MGIVGAGLAVFVLREPWVVQVSWYPLSIWVSFGLLGFGLVFGVNGSIQLAWPATISPGCSRHFP